MKKLLFTFSILFFACSIVPAQTPRLSLFEEFTGETCNPCAATNPNLNITLANNASNVVAIKWQVPIPSAPTKTWSLYQTNKTEINWRSSYVGNTFAPEGRIDGQNLTVFGAPSDHGGDLTSTVIANASAVSSPFSITMTRQWNHSCSASTLTVVVQASSNFTSAGNLVFRTVMVEKVISFSVQPGTNGEKTFKDVAIKSFPSIQSGTPLQKSWTNGQSFTFTLTCDLPAYVRDKSQVAFVGFIQDDGNKKVLQAARTATDVVPAESISQVSAESQTLVCSGAITPTVSFKNEGASAITAATIVPFDGAVAGVPTTWTGNLAPQASVIIPLNSTPVGTVSGTHNLYFDVYLNVPTYNMLGNRKSSQFIVASQYEHVNVQQGFTSTFPPAKWAVLNPNGGATWGKTNAAGGYNHSFDAVMYACFSNTVIGDVDELYLPPTDLTGAGEPELSFDMAYATQSAREDRLKVLVSDDCGQNWKVVYNKAGLEMTTVDDERTTVFYPATNDSTEWTTEKVVLTGFNKAEVLVKFVAYNDNGNNIFLDNINLQRFSEVGVSENKLGTTLSIFPNPSGGKTNLVLNSESASTVNISVVNMVGQVCFDKAQSLNAGRNEVAIDGNLQAGVYNVSIQRGNEVITKKLIIIK